MLTSEDLGPTYYQCTIKETDRKQRSPQKASSPIPVGGTAFFVRCLPKPSKDVKAMGPTSNYDTVGPVK